MEYRKLISFGKSSYVVSLPKPWVTQNKLKKGDLIYFDENKNNLVLQANPQNNNSEEKKISLSIDGKSLKRIQRELIAAYINDYKTITLVGKEIKNKAKEIQETIQKMVALEIVEQDSQKIVARDFLNIKDISMDQIIRKMDIISRSMLSDCQKVFKEDGEESYQSIHHRDEDINKFRLLVYRIVWNGLENPATALKNYKLTQQDLFNYWWLSFSIEQVGDCVKRIARYMKDIELSPKSQQEFTRLLGKIEEDYLGALKAYNTHNVEIAHEVAGHRGELVTACEDFFAQHKDTPLMGYLIYNTKALVVSIHAIVRIVYQGIPAF